MNEELSHTLKFVLTTILSNAHLGIKVKFGIEIWIKVFKNGPSKICGRQPLKHLNWYGLPKQPYHFKFLKDIFYEFLNALTHILVYSN